MKELQDIESTIYWLNAVDYQGNRLIQSHKIEGHIFHTTSKMEEQFFINAAHKACRWASKLKELGGAEKEMDAFLNSVDTQFLRNKREHDDNYLGMNSKKEPLVEAIGESNLKLHVGQSVTVIRNGKILLGGTLDVHGTIEAANTALEPLINIQHEYWETRHASQFKSPRGLIDK